MVSIERPGCWSKAIAATVVCAWALTWGTTPASAGDDLWVEYDEQTSLRMIVRPGIGLNDNQEKDFAWGDVDNDGDNDLVVVRKRPWTFEGGRENILFLQEGVADGQAVDGVFVDRTLQYVPDFTDQTNDRDVILADLNGDGWLDMATATTLSDGLPKSISHPRVYFNLGESGGEWQGFDFDADRTPQLTTVGGLDVAPRFCSVAAGDIDMDGDMDLYFGDYDGSGAGGGNQPPSFDLNDRLLLNDGTGNFTDSVESRLTSTMLESAFGMAVEIADMNNDGVPDIVKDTALNPPQYVSISYNDPDNPGFFDRFDIAYQLDPDGATPYHIDTGDLNNDGWLDIVVTEDNVDVYLLSQGTDSNGIVQFGLPRTLNGSLNNEFGGNNLIVDLDNDGFNDVIVTDVDVDISGCNDPTRLYRNFGDVPNVTLSDVDGFQPWTPRGAHDVAAFDFTGDGFVDLIWGTCDGFEVWVNQPASSLAFTFPGGLPEEVVPNATTNVPVTVAGLNAEPVPGSVQMFASVDGGPFEAAGIVETGDNQYVANLPAATCGSSVRFYFSGETTAGGTFLDPADAPENAYSVDAVYARDVIVDERFEMDNAEWTVTDIDVETGSWVRVDPVQTIFGGNTAQPGDDFGDGDETMCYVTGQHGGGGAGSNDLDGGPTILTSPVFDLDGAVSATIEYARWMFNSGSNQDELVTEITNNGSDWEFVDATTSTNGEWELTSFDVADFVAPSSTVQIRFVIEDAGEPSLTEGGIDNVSVVNVVCDDSFDPELIQTSSLIPFSLQGFSGYIDPRAESSNGSDLNRGLDEITLVFSEPVRNVGGASLSAAAFTVTETGGGTAPNVTGVVTSDDQTVTLQLDRIVTLQEWTTIRADVEDFAGNLIAECDGCDVRPNELSIAFLPGDVDQSGSVSPLDLFAYRQLVNGISDPQVGTLADLVDTNRDGNITPVDLFAYRQLVNGVGTSTRTWAGTSLNNTQP